MPTTISWRSPPPPTSSALRDFLASLERAKVERWRLDETPRAVALALQPAAARVWFVAAAVLGDDAPAETLAGLRLRGRATPFNSRASFAAADKDALLADEARQLWGAVRRGDAPALARVALLTLSDAKARTCVAWLALPSLALAIGAGAVADVCRAEIGAARPLAPAAARALGAAFVQLCRRSRSGLLPAAVLRECAQPPSASFPHRVCLNLAPGEAAEEFELETLAEGDAAARAGSRTRRLLLLLDAAAGDDAGADLLRSAGGELDLPWHLRGILTFAGLRFDWAAAEGACAVLFRPSCAQLLSCATEGSPVDRFGAPPPGGGGDGDLAAAGDCDGGGAAPGALLLPLRLHPPPALVALARAADGDDAAPPPSLVAVGFQLDECGRAAPRLLRLNGGAGSPASLAVQAEEAAEAASRLNLDLMRWRALPELEPARAAALRVLLLGAGTLGCHLSRALLAWGVRAITLVDGGRVSLSSPVRQPLYEHADAAGGGRWKAEAAAAALRRICPSAETAGVVLEIPSPGRPAPPPGSAAAAAQAAAVAQLDELVSSHDVVFLLTDTRESRWLPTVFAAARGTPSFTLALGVDSLLCLRSHSCAEGSGGASGDLPAPRLCCYFCSDPTAPCDGSSGRAMDEACTISRPGLAPIASALAAELVVALLHHAHRFSALDAAGGAQGSPLGVAPQQLRLDLQSLTVRVGAARAFVQCSACSEAVLSEFRRDRGAFLHRALCPSGPAFLEELSGLAALKAARDALAGGGDGEVADEGWAAC